MTNYLHNPKVYICNKSGRTAGTLDGVDAWTDYALVAGLTENDPSVLPQAFCRPEHHNGDGANVLYLDGSVQWLTSGDFTALTNNLFKGLPLGLPPQHRRQQARHQ